MDVLPRGNGVEKGTRHPNKLCISDRMEGTASGGTRNHVQLANSVTLTIFCNNINAATFFIVNGSQTTINDDIETVAGITRAPEYLTCIHLNPVQGAINVEDFEMVLVKYTALT